MEKELSFNLQTTFRRLMALVIKRYAFFRLAFLVSCDFAITFFSFIAAIYIYTRVAYIPYLWSMIYAMISVAVIVKFTLFITFRIYKISFQYAGALYIFKTSSVIFAACLLDYGILKSIFPGYWFFVVSILEFLFDIIGSISFRFLPLIYTELAGRLGEVDKDCLIYGCGDTGKGLIPVLAKNRIRVKGFIDDDPSALGKIVNGVKVLGVLKDLENVLAGTKLDMMVIAIPSLSGQDIKNIRRLCFRFNMELKIIPTLYQIYKIGLERMALPIRDINYEDLLRRPVKKENFSDLHDFFKSKKIIVTGAGSIGAELVHQLASFEPERITVLDNNELSIFNLENSIGERYIDKIKIKLVDLKSEKLLSKIFAENRPDMVFHTAAYKHVPIVEQNICEGIFNNLACFKNVYEISKKCGVKKFIFISSDKAVRPTNIMGATKRLGELYIQAGEEADMVSCSVRFGNVIGSSGSLVPKIISQIQSNEEVTITHPEASRFFMLVSEAVLLILKASTLASGKKVFILDMGKPIKIFDMAKEIINFYGKVPEQDIPIKFIGLRPGEKLIEELVSEEYENAIYKDGIYITTPKGRISDDFAEDYDKMLGMARNGDESAALSLITKYVDLYTNEQLAKRIKI